MNSHQLWHFNYLKLLVSHTESDHERELQFGEGVIVSMRPTHTRKSFRLLNEMEKME